MKQLRIINNNCLMVSGDLTFYTIMLLDRAVLELLFANSVISEINLAGVKNCDSAALLFLCSVWRQTQQQKNHLLRFSNIPLQLTRLISLSNLEKILVEIL